MPEVFPAPGQSSDASVPSPTLIGRYFPHIDFQPPEEGDGYKLRYPLGSGSILLQLREGGGDLNLSSTINGLWGANTLASGSVSRDIDDLFLEYRSALQSASNDWAQQFSLPNFALPQVVGITDFDNILAELNDLNPIPDGVPYISSTSPDYQQNGDFSWAESYSLSDDSNRLEFKFCAANTDGTIMLAGSKHTLSTLEQLYVSVDGGSNWTQVNAGPDIDFLRGSVSGTGDKMIASSPGQAGFHISVNSGTSFTLKTNGIGGTTAGITPCVVSRDGIVFYGASTVGGLYAVYRSADGGDNWTSVLLGSDIATTNSIDCSEDGQIVYVGGRRTSSNLPFYFKSTNQGTSFTAVEPSEFTTVGTDLFISCDRYGDRLIAAEGGGFVFLSTDGGSSWTKDGTLESNTWREVRGDDIHGRLVAIGHNDSVYAAVAYVSLDAGATWTADDNGIASFCSGTICGDGSKAIRIDNAGAGNTIKLRVGVAIVLGGFLDTEWDMTPVRSLARTYLSKFTANEMNTVVGLGTGDSPTWTAWTLSSAVPYGTLSNTTEEDTDGGRESRLNFRGEQSGGEATTLVRIQGSHDGASDDEKGQIEFFTNDGSDTDTPTLRTTIDAVGKMTHSGDALFQAIVDSTTGFQWLDTNGGTPVLNIDTTNERVGFGTAAPQELVHVGAGTGASAITATDLLVTRAGPSNLSVKDSTNVVETFLFASSAGGITGTVTNDPLDIKTNNTSAIFIDASQNITVAGDMSVAGALTATSHGGIVEANLLDKTAAETISGAWEFTAASTTLSSTQPILDFNETDGPVDEKFWRWTAAIGDLYLQTKTDALGAGANVLRITRTGTTVDLIRAVATSVDVVGALTATSYAGTSIDLGGTTLLASRSLTVDTGGVFDINLGTASGDDFTIDTSAFVVEGDNGNVGLGTLSFGTSAARELAIGNGTLGAAAANMVQIASEDNGAGNATLLVQPESGTALRYGSNILDVESGELRFGSVANQLVVDAAGNVRIGTASAAAKLDIGGAVKISDVVNFSGTNKIHQVSGHNFMQGDATTTYLYGGTSGFQWRKADNSEPLMFLLDNGDIQIGSPPSASGAVLTVEQTSMTGVKPVLQLRQLDISEDMIDFHTTIGTGNAIEVVGAKSLTTTHFIKVTVPGGLTRYLEVGTIA